MLGQIHVAFDGWRSRNRHALYVIVCFYVGHGGVPCKLVLGLPELKIAQSGDNIAAQILEILDSYEIKDKVGYITLDNAANMDTAAEGIAFALGFDPKQRRVRCFGHVINLVVRALLFGHRAEASKPSLMETLAVPLCSMSCGERKDPSASCTIWFTGSIGLTS